MKVVYLGKSAMRSKGYRFEPNTEYELVIATANYLLKVFPKLFKLISVEDAPKAESKTKPAEDAEMVEEVKPKKPARKSQVKKVVAPEE